MFTKQQLTSQGPTARRSRVARLLGTLAVASALAVAVAGPASAGNGYEGKVYDFGAQCWYNQLIVNAPHITAYDATTAVDQQWIAFRPEIWRFNETTNAWDLFQTAPEGWDIAAYDDGTQGNTYMTMAGTSTFNISTPGSYRAAILFVWASTAVTPEGSTYTTRVWVESHFNSDIASYLGLFGMAQGQYCTF